MYIDKIKDVFKKGLFHLFGANFILKISVFLTSFVLVRIFDVETFGLWSYSLNILSFFILFQGIGSHASILQFASKETDKSKIKGLFLFGIKRNVLVNIVLIIAGIVFLQFYEMKIPQSNRIISLLLISLVFVGTTESFYSYYRSLLENHKYSLLITFFAITRAILFISFAYLWGIIGLVIAQSATSLLTTVYGVITDKNHTIVAMKPNKKLRKEFDKFSLLNSSNNLLSQSVYLLDVFLVGQILVDSYAVGIYKTATMIPYNLSIIPVTFMIFLYPYIRKNYEDIKFLKQTVISTMLKMGLINLLIAIPLYILAPFIVRILFTESYNDSIIPFRILIIGFFIGGTFRIPFGNIIAAIHKVSVNMVITVVCGIFNVLLDIYLIKKLGINGAAYATVSTFLLSSILSLGYLVYYIKRKSNENSLSE